MVFLVDAQLAGGGTYYFAATGRTVATTAPSETLAATGIAAIPPAACHYGLGMVKEKIKKFFFGDFTGDSSIILDQTGSN